MFKRAIIESLTAWAASKGRKPLVLSGARQVGKTTLVHQFAQNFEQYVYLNLELSENRLPFEQFTDIPTLIRALFFIKNQSYDPQKSTLIFIDEIQELPKALNILRYFYEEAKQIHVIAAGSLLEILFDKNISFPVGRVEYMVLHPVSFPEFLGAMNETAALKQLNRVPLDAFAHEKLMNLFHTYALIGGMPEIVSHYAQNKDLTALSTIYESILVSYFDDVEKYARSNTHVQYLRHAITASLNVSGMRFNFAGFGNSNYGSREMGEALRLLEKALVINIIYPHTGFTVPILPNQKKSPKLQFLDTGLINYSVGLQREILGITDLNKVYKGRMIEHLIGQELLATQVSALHALNFWVREKKNSTAEIDFIYSYNGKLIPVEVKSGKTGTLKSLHLYMNQTPHRLAIRYYSGKHDLSIISLDGLRYNLLSLPYYSVSNIENYLNRFYKAAQKF